MPLDEADELLLAGIRQGNPEAWEEFIGRFEGRLTAFVRSRIGDAATTEDIVQEAFTGFLISLPNYNPATPLETFLFTITAHKLTDVLRRTGRRPEISLTPASEDDEGGSLEPAGPSRKASSLARSRERTGQEERVLSDCLGGLIGQWKSRGEFERLQCAELLFVLGWSNKDVAHRMGISEQSVANHKQFVVSKLKDAARAAGLRDFDPLQIGVTGE